MFILWQTNRGGKQTTKLHRGSRGRLGGLRLCSTITITITIGNNTKGDGRDSSDTASPATPFYTRVR